jgi:hypothetical protein
MLVSRGATVLGLSNWWGLSHLMLGLWLVVVSAYWACTRHGQVNHEVPVQWVGVWHLVNRSGPWSPGDTADYWRCETFEM